MAGRGVQVIGLDLKNGGVQATRLTVYEGTRPVRIGAGKLCPAPEPGSTGSAYRHAFNPPGSTVRLGFICGLAGGNGIVSVI
ncbi:MAG: hypothetical protein LC130_26650 [Bryobacterales bacterium]|nr:hypothetical protein [Bryobacterales bacterium]